MSSGCDNDSSRKNTPRSHDEDKCSAIGERRGSLLGHFLGSDCWYIFGAKIKEETIVRVVEGSIVITIYYLQFEGVDSVH
jgi:hypothetical protein